MFPGLDCTRTYAGSSCSSAGKNADLSTLVPPLSVGKSPLLLSTSLDRNSKHLSLSGVQVQVNNLQKASLRPEESADQISHVRSQTR